MSTTTLPVTTHAPLSVAADSAPLSPHRAFLVQFRVGSGHDPASFFGRVEHVVSGHTARFHTLEELLEFMTRELGRHTAQDKGGNDP